jgi:hypothetical protein
VQGPPAKCKVIEWDGPICWLACQNVKCYPKAYEVRFVRRCSFIRPGCWLFSEAFWGFCWGWDGAGATGEARARETRGGRGGLDRLSHADPPAARAGHRRRDDDTLRAGAGRAGGGDATRHLDLSGETGGPDDTSDRQSALPALLEATVPAVLSPLQSLQDEVLSARSLAVLGLRATAVRDRQHESGEAAWHGEKRGDRAGNPRHGTSPRIASGVRNSRNSGSARWDRRSGPISITRCGLRVSSVIDCCAGFGS